MTTPTVYTLKNECLEVQVIDVGATLISMKHHSDDINIIVRYEDLNTYVTDNGAYLGSSIGPVTGRLADARLDTIQLIPNEPHNSLLHSGVSGIHAVVFDCVVTEKSLRFTATVDHIQDGFPGIVDYVITYTLEGCELVLNHLVTPHQAQYINTTNHAYFNLVGSDSVAEHTFLINADQISLVNEFGWYKGDRLDVKGTIFDFTSPQFLSQAIEGQHDQYQFTKNLDHFFYGNHVTVSFENKVLDITTDRLGFQVYTANHFNESFKVENGRLGKSYSSVALEPQSFNNEPNIGSYPRFDKDHPYTATTRYRLSFKD